MSCCIILHQMIHLGSQPAGAQYAVSHPADDGRTFRRLTAGCCFSAAAAVLLGACAAVDFIMGGRSSIVGLAGFVTLPSRETVARSGSLLLSWEAQ